MGLLTAYKAADYRVMKLAAVGRVIQTGRKSGYILAMVKMTDGTSRLSWLMVEGIRCR